MWSWSTYNTGFRVFITLEFTQFISVGQEKVSQCFQRFCVFYSLPPTPSKFHFIHHPHRFQQHRGKEHWPGNQSPGSDSFVWLTSWGTFGSNLSSRLPSQGCGQDYLPEMFCEFCDREMCVLCLIEHSPSFMSFVLELGSPLNFVSQLNRNPNIDLQINLIYFGTVLSCV